MFAAICEKLRDTRISRREASPCVESISCRHFASQTVEDESCINRLGGTGPERRGAEPGRHQPRGTDCIRPCLRAARSGPLLLAGLEELGASANGVAQYVGSCLLYTSDAADEEDSVDLGG